MLKIVKQTSFLVITGILLVLFLPGYAKIQELRQKNRELEANARRLQAENLAMQVEKEKLERDPEYLERVGREKLGIVRKGEIIYRVIPEKEKSPSGKQE